MRRVALHKVMGMLETTVLFELVSHQQTVRPPMICEGRLKARLFHFVLLQAFKNIQKRHKAAWAPRNTEPTDVLPCCV